MLLLRSLVLLRSLAFQLLLIGSSIVYALAILVFTRHKFALAQSWARFNLQMLKRLCHLDYRVQGLERLPADNAIVLCKHQSAWEILALRALLPPRQCWVLKQELLRIPIFGPALACLDPIPIDRAAARRELMHLLRAGTERLGQGYWLIVFPEGTRVAPGAKGTYSIGGALLAERTGYPVVPVVHNAGTFWGRRSLIKRPGTIELVFGQPIATQGRKAAEINAETERWIEERLEIIVSHPSLQPKAGKIQTKG
ncbi:1-acyl-sn-glycerol-3-phosphate acyltransferase [Caldichromatium japonicum]|uniref:1-acyl-sn-glycerol-3-phosphate acyltransferase n=2 Tax=Caldichromatium japonicum TaxID=2699430 RepID=A0A6G7VGX7_9GAMM|nr:1-acyl-sn-glycerol-3-phosphate acyltransferase [Caldichromatium japonicum]